MEKLTDLPNIGWKVEQLLNEAGIRSVEELRALGAEEAFIRLKQVEPTA